MKKSLSVVAIISIVLSMASCGSGSSSYAYPSSTSSASKGVSFADKKAYVEREFADIICNDFRNELPYSDMIGLPLSQLKAAVNASDTWSEDTSMWASLSETAGLNFEEFAYTFSNRAFNLEGGMGNNIKSTIISHIIAGAGNMLSADLESATYVYVLTDGSSQQLISSVVVCITNTGKTSNEIAELFYSAYKSGLASDEDDAFDTYAGLISDVDYEELYNWGNGLSSEFPSCYGGLNYYYTDNGSLVFEVFSVAAVS